MLKNIKKIVVVGLVVNKISSGFVNKGFSPSFAFNIKQI